MDSRILVVDTIWCRLLCTLERLEIVEGLSSKRTTECHDAKSDPPSEGDKAELISEFEFQKKAFFVGVKPISEHLDRYKTDYTGWCAGLTEADSPDLDRLCRLLGMEFLGIGGFEMELPTGGLSMDRAQAPKTQGGSIGLKLEEEDHSHVRGAHEDGVRYLISLDDRFEGLGGGESGADDETKRTDR